MDMQSSSRKKKQKDAEIELIKSLRGSLGRFITKEPEGLSEHLGNEEHTHEDSFISLNIYIGEKGNGENEVVNNVGHDEDMSLQI